MSTTERPKQFLPIFQGQSLLQRTVARLREVVGEHHVWIATTEGYRDLVREQLPSFESSRILLEPARRNTAAAIATCCARISEQLPDAVIGIFPSDHAIGDETAFGEVVDRAFEFASRGSHLLTIGIEPDSPNASYGYLERGQPVAEGVVSVLRFVEKPDLVKAAEYVESGRYLWNAGMFVWRADTFFTSLRSAAPALSAQLDRWIGAADDGRSQIYASMEALSIDYALMEKASNVATVPGSFGWSDIGNWRALADFTSDTGAVHKLRSEGSRVLSESGRPIAVVGLPNVVVVETPRGILVLDPTRDEGLSDMVRKIEE